MEKPIRILQIVPNMQQGGLENFIMNIYRNIDRKKVQFDFLVHYAEKKYFDDEIEKLGGKIFRFSLREDNKFFSYIKQLNDFFKEHKEYNVIHCHMASMGFIIFLIAKKNGVKVRIAHSHNANTEKSFKGFVKRILIKPLKYISTVNFACSQKAGKFLFGNKKFEVVPNAIDVNKFKFSEEKRREYRNKLDITETQFVIGHIGRFNVQKNHKFIVNVFNKYLKINPNAILLLIGDGELIGSIKERCIQLNIQDKVVFIGNVNNPYDYYSAMDLFILPSLFEGLPVVGVEAQANGLKCLFADNITKEVKLIDSSEYLDLNIDNWVEKINEIFQNKKTDRGYTYKTILKSDFEITKTVQNMEKIYMNFNNNI